MDTLPTIETLSNKLEYPNGIFNKTQTTITSLYASNPSMNKSPKDAVEILLEKPIHHLRSKEKHELFEHEVTKEEMNIAAKYGQFPQRPSDLFLKLFYGVIRTLEHNPMSGCVSPALVGTSAVIPLTIISTIPDIMQHYHHVIVHAQKEVLFATCWWEKGEIANMMDKALRDLSKRAAREKRQVIVKLLIDHLSKENITHRHAILPSNKWAQCNLPTMEELPFISMEVNCYHRLIMGTFHSKFLIVDRKIALLNSNNIYDRPNLEMMVHYQGDIVNSFYDTFLISWSIPFEPDLVCLQEETPANQDFLFGMDNSTLVSIKEPLQRAVARARLQLQRNQNTENKFSTPTINRKVTHLTFHDAARKALVEIRNTCSFDKSTIQSLTIDFTPFIFHTRHQPIPIALVNRSPNGTPGHIDKINPQDIAWLYAFRYAQKSLFIQSPNLNATPAIDGIISACRRGIKVILWLDFGYNYLKEGFGTFQGGTNEHIVKKIYKELKSHNNGADKNLQIFWYTAKDQIRPCHFSEKKRNCHIKFMSIDDQVAIVGSGNMDTQTWFHSQEMNTMIDSPVIVKEWMNALCTNQSTNEYGRLNDNGEWHGINGNINS